jgi:dephospho-CoA kinase
VNRVRQGGLTKQRGAAIFKPMKGGFPVIGLLGGIGSGKSTAARCFARLGCAVIDADAIAHQVLREPAVIREIAERFGPGVLGADGQVDRKKLAEMVFSSKEKLEMLNQIVHPLVLGRCEELLRRYQQEGKPVVIDMPLLAEVGWDKRCDVLVFVDCPEELRLQRIRQRGEGDGGEQKKRENFQISLDKKKKMAQYILENNSEESELFEQVEKVFSAIRDQGRLSTI